MLVENSSINSCYSNDSGDIIKSNHHSGSRFDGGHTHSAVLFQDLMIRMIPNRKGSIKLMLLLLALNELVINGVLISSFVSTTTHGDDYEGVRMNAPLSPLLQIPHNGNKSNLRSTRSNNTIPNKKNHHHGNRKKIQCNNQTKYIPYVFRWQEPSLNIDERTIAASTTTVSKQVNITGSFTKDWSYSISLKKQKSNDNGSTASFAHVQKLKCGKLHTFKFIVFGDNFEHPNDESNEKEDEGGHKDVLWLTNPKYSTIADEFCNINNVIDLRSDDDKHSQDQNIQPPELLLMEENEQQQQKQQQRSKDEKNGSTSTIGKIVHLLADTITNLIESTTKYNDPTSFAIQNLNTSQISCGGKKCLVPLQTTTTTNNKHAYGHNNIGYLFLHDGSRKQFDTFGSTIDTAGSTGSRYYEYFQKTYRLANHLTRKYPTVPNLFIEPPRVIEDPSSLLQLQELAIMNPQMMLKCQHQQQQHRPSSFVIQKTKIISEPNWLFQRYWDDVDDNQDTTRTTATVSPHEDTDVDAKQEQHLSSQVAIIESPNSTSSSSDFVSEGVGQKGKITDINLYLHILNNLTTYTTSTNAAKPIGSSFLRSNAQQMHQQQKERLKSFVQTLMQNLNTMRQIVLEDPDFVCLLHDFQFVIDKDGTIHYIDLDRCYEEYLDRNVHSETPLQPTSLEAEEDAPSSLSSSSLHGMPPTSTESSENKNPNIATSNDEGGSDMIGRNTATTTKGVYEYYYSKSQHVRLYLNTIENCFQIALQQVLLSSYKQNHNGNDYHDDIEMLKYRYPYYDGC